jgi:hypothetical protein
VDAERERAAVPGLEHIGPLIFIGAAFSRHSCPARYLQALYARGTALMASNRVRDIVLSCIAVSLMAAIALVMAA